jgi:hypothetical protein
VARIDVARIDVAVVDVAVIDVAVVDVAGRRGGRRRAPPPPRPPLLLVVVGGGSQSRSRGMTWLVDGHRLADKLVVAPTSLNEGRGWHAASTKRGGGRGEVDGVWWTGHGGRGWSRGCRPRGIVDVALSRSLSTWCGPRLRGVVVVLVDVAGVVDVVPSRASWGRGVSCRCGVVGVVR